MRVMTSNSKKSIELASVLVIWIYLKAYFALLEIFCEGTLVSYLYYGIILVFLIVVIFKMGLVINRKLLYFFGVYIVALLINASIVSYRGYVLIEGITSLIIFSLPLYLLSNTKFEFEIFINKWILYGKYNSIILIIYILLNKADLIDYGVFAGITLPNIIVLSYAYWSKKEKSIKTLALIIFNLLTTVMFSGRMAAVASIATFFASLIICEKRKINQLIFMIALGVGMGVLLYNLENAVGIGIQIVDAMGMESRTLYLLQEQLKKGGLFENIYMTNREYIYDIGVNYVKERWGLPGGFAVIRELTYGKYYHAHNLVLELMIFFGIGGSGLILITALYRYKIIQKYYNKVAGEICLILICFYGVYSLTGSSFLDSFASILIVGILFFYRKEPQLLHPPF